MDFAHLEKCQCEKESKAFWLWPLSLFHNYGIVLLDYACFFPSWRLVFLQDHYGDHYLKCLLCSFWYKQLVLDCLSFICQISVWCTSTVRRLWKYTLKKPHYFTAKFQWKILCFFFHILSWKIVCDGPGHWEKKIQYLCRGLVHCLCAEPKVTVFPSPVKHSCLLATNHSQELCCF